MNEDQVKHGLVSDLQKLAQEFGRTPTRTQFLNSGMPNVGKFPYFFETWSRFLDAAGLAPNIMPRRKRIDNSIFEKDIVKHLEEYRPVESNIPVVKVPWPNIAILGDLHEPWGSDKVKSSFVSFVEKTQPEYVIQMGDLLDMYSHSKFPKSQNVYTPKDEEDAGIKNARELWSKIRKAAPKAKCVGLLGNHDIRPLKRTLESAPQLEHWVEKYFKDLMQFDGVEMILDPRQEYIIADIAFIHGYLSKLGAHRDFMLMNTVRGHDHVGGVVFRQIHGKVLWELDAGLAGEYDSKALSYMSQKMTKQTNGFAYIDSYGPRFIPI